MRVSTRNQFDLIVNISSSSSQQSLALFLTWVNMVPFIQCMYVGLECWWYKRALEGTNSYPCAGTLFKALSAQMQHKTN